METVDTDRKGFRDQLRHRRALLERVVDALAPHE